MTAPALASTQLRSEPRSRKKEVKVWPQESFRADLRTLERPPIPRGARQWTEKEKWCPKMQHAAHDLICEQRLTEALPIISVTLLYQVEILRLLRSTLFTLPSRKKKIYHCKEAPIRTTLHVDMFLKTEKNYYLLKCVPCNKYACKIHLLCILPIWNELIYYASCMYLKLPFKLFIHETNE